MNLKEGTKVISNGICFTVPQDGRYSVRKDSDIMEKKEDLRKSFTHTSPRPTTKIPLKGNEPKNKKKTTYKRQIIKELKRYQVKLEYRLKALAREQQDPIFDAYAIAFEQVIMVLDSILKEGGSGE